MSADNGIYILKTRNCRPPVGDPKSTPPITFEYRVIHAMAIENIYWDPEKLDDREDSQFTPEIAFQYFGEAEVYEGHLDALNHAQTLFESHDILEYGICTLDHSDQVFQTFSPEEIQSFEEQGEVLLKQHHAKEKAQRDAKLKAATIPLKEGMVFEPATLIGYLIKEDGTKVHGSFSGLDWVFVGERGEIRGLGKNFRFLPSDWYEG